MPPLEPSHDLTVAAARDFRTTHWSLVLTAGQGAPAEAAPALEQLCRAYWYPLYTYVRRRGHPPEEAQDLVQEFFSQLLERKDLGTVDRARGKFRSFLMASMNHLEANEWKKANRQKRGGGALVFSLDEQDAEGRFQHEPASDWTPEKAFERRWAETLLQQVLALLRAEFKAAGLEPRYDLLKPYLLSDEEPEPCVGLAARLGLTASGVKSAIRRMKLRYAEIFREEIARTVSTPEEIDEEIRHLFAALGG